MFYCLSEPAWEVINKVTRQGCDKKSFLNSLCFVPKARHGTNTSMTLAPTTPGNNLCGGTSGEMCLTISFIFSEGQDDIMQRSNLGDLPCFLPMLSKKRVQGDGSHDLPRPRNCKEPSPQKGTDARKNSRNGIARSGIVSSWEIFSNSRSRRTSDMARRIPALVSAAPRKWRGNSSMTCSTRVSCSFSSPDFMCHRASNP